MEGLGNKIKELRETAGMTIDTLAQAANITSESVEKIERDELDPGIATLARFAGCMNVRLGTILDGGEDTMPVITRVGEAKEGERSADCDAIIRKNIHYRPLSTGKHNRNMEPYIMDVDYLPDWQRELNTHEGEEFLFVLEGDITIHYGQTVYELHKGDTIYFESVVPHCISSIAENRKARTISVFYIPA